MLLVTAKIMRVFWAFFCHNISTIIDVLLTQGCTYDPSLSSLYRLSLSDITYEFSIHDDMDEDDEEQSSTTTTSTA